MPITEELLEDAPSLDFIFWQKVGTIFDFQIKFALIQGSGVGQPLGMLNSGSLDNFAENKHAGGKNDHVGEYLAMWQQLLPGSENRVLVGAQGLPHAVDADVHPDTERR